jgi:hypothetical protein
MRAAWMMENAKYPDRMQKDIDEKKARKLQ